MRRPAPTFVYAPPRKPPRGREPKRTGVLDVYEARDKLMDLMDAPFRRDALRNVGHLNPQPPRARARSAECDVVTSSDIMGGLGAEVAAAVRRAMKGLG